MLKNTSAMNLGALRQDITAVLEECYSQGMQLPYLFVAVSLDGKLIGVRFTKAEDSDGLDPVPNRWQPECGCYHAPAHQRHDCRCHWSGSLRANVRAGAGNVSLLVTLGESVSRTNSLGSYSEAERSQSFG
jgi:hypothetical protein